MKKNNRLKIIVIAIIILLILFALPYVFTRPNFIGFDFRETGSIGDTIGGILGPFIAIIAAILTFLAFYIQYQANEQQKKDLKIERFENKFYELLKLHKANVDEMKLGNNINGRECFVNMFRELRFIYRMCEFSKNKLTKYEDENEELINIDLMSFSYKLFFFGISINSKKYFNDSLSIQEQRLYNVAKQDLDPIYQRCEYHFKSSNLPYEYKYSSSQTNENSIEFGYLPFQGHINKLGHYYRHLYQTAKFIIENESFNSKEKYAYIKTLRAQLPEFEQLLLYYNSLAWFRNEWKELFVEYRLIKNISIPLADFGTTPLELFKNEIKEYKEKGIALFEYLE